jgi:hypothetical protein
MLNSTTTLIVVLLLILFVFICREIACWYWKINQIVDLMLEISYKLDLLQQSNPPIKKPEDLKL